MPDKYMYRTFGLDIESELALPELYASEGPADVSVSFGKVPEHLDSPTQSTPWLEEKPGEFLLTVDSAARYYVQGSNCIVIEPLIGSDEDDIRTFLYDSVFAAVLQQRGILALHGSAAVINEKAVAILGKSAVGKTAVALALYDSGCPLLADEICAVDVQDGHAVVYPGIPKLGVWKDTLKTAGKEPDGLRPIRRGLQKFSFPVSDRFAAAPVALSHIFLLADYNQEELLAEPIKGGNKLKTLLQEFFKETAPDLVKHFRVCAAVSPVSMTKINFNCIAGNAKKVADLIAKEMGV